MGRLRKLVYKGEGVEKSENHAYVLYGRSISILTFSGVVEGVNSVTVMMGRDMEWMGGGGTGGTTASCGASSGGGGCCFVEPEATAADAVGDECAGVPDGELILRSP